MNIHKLIKGIHNEVIHDSILDVSIQLTMSIIEFWISNKANNDHG